MNQNNGKQKKEYMYEKIADLLEQDIIHDRFDNQKLPSEQELAVTYSASRTVIREALKILGERHLVNSVVGSGAYITKPGVDELSTTINRLISTHDISIIDAIDVRIILESNAAALAAMNATPEEFDEMDKIRLRLGDPNCATEERAELDFMFHTLVCKASHNDMLALITEAIGSVVRELININLIAGEHNPAIVRHISHMRILSALRERNPVAAQSITYDHLYSTKILYNEYITRQMDAENKHT